MIKSQEVLPLKQHFSSPSQSESLEQSCVHDAYLLLRGTFGQTPCLVLSRHIALNKENNPTLGGSSMYHTTHWTDLLLVLIIISMKIVVDYIWNFSISRIVCKVFSYDLFVKSSAPKKFFMKIRYKTNKNNYESLRFRWVICLFYWKENLKKSTILWNVNKLSFFSTHWTLSKIFWG